MGYHELTGSKVTLKKPLLVLKKLQKGTDGSSKKETELEVVGIIRSKILFKTRPKPLFSGITSLFCSCLLSETLSLKLALTFLSYLFDSGTN